MIAGYAHRSMSGVGNRSRPAALLNAGQLSIDTPRGVSLAQLELGKTGNSFISEDEVLVC